MDELNVQSKKAFLLAPFSIRDYPGAAQWSETKKKKNNFVRFFDF